MKSIRPLLDRVISDSLRVLRSKKAKIFTFAFYHDHESGSVSVCADTEASSRRLVASSNAYSLKYFWPAVEAGALEDVALWNANIGRSLSLGDFAFVNLARIDLPSRRVPKNLYVEMMMAVRSREADILKLAPAKSRMLFCCSGPDDELAFTWSPERKNKKTTQLGATDNPGDAQ